MAFRPEYMYISFQAKLPLKTEINQIHFKMYLNVPLFLTNGLNMDFKKEVYLTKVPAQTVSKMILRKI